MSSFAGLPGYDENGIPTDLPHFDFEPNEWMEQAACRGVDNPDIFHSASAANIRAAKAICAGCPVTAECAEYAEAFPAGLSGGDDNVFGGLTYRERRDTFGPRTLGPNPRQFARMSRDNRRREKEEALARAS